MGSRVEYRRGGGEPTVEEEEEEEEEEFVERVLVEVLRTDILELFNGVR